MAEVFLLTNTTYVSKQLSTERSMVKTESAGLQCWLESEMKAFTWLPFHAGELQIFEQPRRLSLSTGFPDKFTKEGLHANSSVSIWYSEKKKKGATVSLNSPSLEGWLYARRNHLNPFDLQGWGFEYMTLNCHDGSVHKNHQCLHMHSVYQAAKDKQSLMWSFHRQRE